MLVIEFVQKFQQKSFIVHFDINRPQSTFAFGPAYHLPGRQGIALVSLPSLLRPKTSPSNIVSDFNKFGRELEHAHEKDHKGGDRRIKPGESPP